MSRRTSHPNGPAVTSAPSAAAPVPETVFYDGACGLCHNTVKFVLARDHAGAFDFAPIGGATFLATFGEADRRTIPDSILIRTSDGRTLVRSSAVMHVLGRLGSGWRLVAALLRVVPRPIRDAGYRAVAAVRRRVFAAPKDSCPVVPVERRKRFRS